MAHHCPDAGLGRAILRTLAYADVFDYPLRSAEVVRYLEGRTATAADVETALREDPTATSAISTRDGYICLAGREALVAIRQERERRAAIFWPRAYRYGRWLGRLPFVRMVAVTGSLAVDNPADRSDIDYFVVTESDALWSARAHAIVLVRGVAALGDRLCPNYFLSTRALALSDRNLFTAHEVTQMVPVHGIEVYREFRAANAWTDAFLPNAQDASRTVNASASRGRLQGTLEQVGRSPVGRWFERWERARKVRRLQARAVDAPEATFTADQCKGHIDSHGRDCLARYAERLDRLGLR
jgi:hypothetical protein